MNRMKVVFHVPPLDKQVGGLSAAIAGLASALRSADVQVDQTDATLHPSAVHHFHGIWNPSFFWPVRQLWRHSIPYVVSPHGMLEPWAFRSKRWKKLPYFWAFERRFLERAACIFVTSELERESVAAIVPHRSIMVLPIGMAESAKVDYIKARRDLGWCVGERIALYLSRIDRKKGLDLLIDALATAPSNFREWRLIVVGDGELSFLRQVMKRVEENRKALLPIEWKGAIWGSEKWRYLQGADLFVLPTRSENFGLAVLEAVSVGTPILTTNATPWAAEADRRGFFIAEPSVESIAQELVHATSALKAGWTTNDRHRLSSWANDNFAWSTLSALYKEQYAAVLGIPNDAGQP